MKNSPLRKLAAGALLAGLSVSMLGGCASSSDLKELSSEAAWDKLEDNKNRTGFVKTLAENTNVSLNDELFNDAQIRAEEESKNAETPVLALDEIVDDVSKYLVSEMPNYAKSQGTEWRLTLAVGTLVDGTEDQVLGTALDRIARNLQRNAEFRKHFKVLSSTKTDAEQIILELSGTHPDDIYLPDSDASDGVMIHPDDLYVLTGRTDVFSTSQNRILKTVTLIDIQHPNSRENVLSADFSRTYYFHPGDMAYISEAENQRRADAQAGGR